jgi:guanyl-specific ribonuclease Sa
MRKYTILILIAVLAFLWWRSHHAAPQTVAGNAPVASTAQPPPAPDETPPALRLPPAQGDGGALPAFLPPEARDTLRLIAQGGPFPHRQDGVVFGNREGRLPKKPYGWYHEYTVETPGSRDRGARRIIAGGTPPEAYWYTDDHYDSFRQFEVPR